MCILLRIFNIQDHIICQGSLFLPFQNVYLFIFSCLTALAGTSRKMLTREGESINPCLEPEREEQAFSLLPLTLMLPVGLL